MIVDLATDPPPKPVPDFHLAVCLRTWGSGKKSLAEIGDISHTFLKEVCIAVQKLAFAWPLVGWDLPRH